MPLCDYIKIGLINKVKMPMAFCEDDDKIINNK